MDIVPVIDIQHSTAVHAVAGRRTRYRPLKSQLARSSDPCELLQAVAGLPNIDACYIADLDAIGRFEQLNRDVLAAARDVPLRLFVDAGVRSVAQAIELVQMGVDQVIVGLESIPDISTARKVLEVLGPEHVVFSIDLKNGRPWTSSADWINLTAEDIAARAADAGFRRFIVLEISRVGIPSGVCTTELCRSVLSAHPAVSVITGGGVRNLSDLKRLQHEGVDAALVGSALHDGRLTTHDLQQFGKA